MPLLELDGPRQDGQLCPKCSKGVLEYKKGRYGGFLGCNKFPKCSYTSNMGINLQKLANDLLEIKGKRKKKRRSKKKAKKI